MVLRLFASRKIFLLLLVGIQCGCAYRLGAPERSLPGGYRQISVPIFRNFSQEPGIEVAFTNAMIQEFNRSKTARVVDALFAEAQINGEIVNVQYRPAGEAVSQDPLPKGTVLATTYTILLDVKISFVRRSDGKVLYESVFSREQPYAAPQVRQAGLNTVNPLYNLSTRRQNIESMANDLMAEAHDRLSENF